MNNLKNELVTLTARYFPLSKSISVEKRNIILEFRIDISQNTFIEIYYNSFTGKKSYALINNCQRIFGYDNYKYWHVHPCSDPSEHIPCSEPSSEEVLCNMRDILTYTE
ncbi:MAG: hypothetical protein ABRQ39_08565 [Candidatus Eremiobacterota bacterium]